MTQSPPNADDALVDAYPEYRAWKWLESECTKRGYAAPADNDYSADELVDAFLAGRDTLSAELAACQAQVAGLREAVRPFLAQHQWPASVRLITKTLDCMAPIPMTITKGQAWALIEALAAVPPRAVLCDEKPQVGSLDDGIPNHTNHTKRGFKP